MKKKKGHYFFMEYVLPILAVLIVIVPVWYFGFVKPVVFLTPEEKLIKDMTKEGNINDWCIGKGFERFDELKIYSEDETIYVRCCNTINYIDTDEHGSEFFGSYGKCKIFEER